MFAVGNNLQKKVIFTNHAKERAIEYGLDLNDLVAMLYVSKLRPMDQRRIINKTAKHGQYNKEYRFENISFVVVFEENAVVIVTVHKS